MVDAGAGITPTQPRLVFDPAGDPVVSYSQQDSIRLAYLLGGVWTSEIVDSGSGAPDLALDPLGRPALCYVGQGTLLHFAQATASGWDIVSAVTDVYAWTCSLAFDLTGNPAIAFAPTNGGSLGVALARRNGSVWTHETIETAPFGVWRLSLAFDANGDPAVAYGTGCSADQRYASVSTSGLVHRGVVPALVPGWQATALPLDAGNDDETAPFPASVFFPGTMDDPLPTAAELVLYRVLGPAGETTGNRLRVVKGPQGETLHY